MKDLIYIHIRILYFNGLRDFIYSYNGIVFSGYFSALKVMPFVVNADQGDDH